MLILPFRTAVCALRICIPCAVDGWVMMAFPLFFSFSFFSGDTGREGHRHCLAAFQTYLGFSQAVFLYSFYTLEAYVLTCPMATLGPNDLPMLCRPRDRRHRRPRGQERPRRDISWRPRGRRTPGLQLPPALLLTLCQRSRKLLSPPRGHLRG